MPNHKWLLLVGVLCCCLANVDGAEVSAMRQVMGELAELRQQVAGLQSALAAVVKQRAGPLAGRRGALHAGPSSCEGLAPPFYPYTYFIEAGGGGGGGGGGAGDDGGPGQASNASVVNKNMTATLLLIADGGGRGAQGGQAGNGGAHGTGSSFDRLIEPIILTGLGGPGGPGGVNKDEVNNPRTGTSGGNGGFVSGTVTLKDGESLLLCAGAGAGGGGQLPYHGAHGAPGFVIAVPLI